MFHPILSSLKEKHQLNINLLQEVFEEVHDNVNFPIELLVSLLDLDPQMTYTRVSETFVTQGSLLILEII